jgi:endogenous inhibitor of DNA gyrase (YacG/DUF329 family)
MTEKKCKICSKLIKASKTKSVYCSNKCKQINYIQNKNKKQDINIIQEPTQTELFLRAQEIQGFYVLHNTQKEFNNYIEESKNKKIEQDRIEKEQKEFLRYLKKKEQNIKNQKTKVFIESLCNMFKNKQNSLSPIKLSELQFPGE